ncbi:uncharacterized protein LOC109503653 [Harpegnathos saltator]|uniref:uncharacterized protein LOC109503653 n=1 Tax=Harpegnathos saltator TaxID=610380 RepID=UPI000DBED868|nr:uncharacterized protein LOC109503653 [Harpegnathos saltator]
MNANRNNAVRDARARETKLGIKGALLNVRFVSGAEFQNRQHPAAAAAAARYGTLRARRRPCPRAGGARRTHESEDRLQFSILNSDRETKGRGGPCDEETQPLSSRNVGDGAAFTARSAAGNQWQWKEEGKPLGGETEGERERIEKRPQESYLTYFLSYVAHRAKRLSKGQKLSNRSALIGANTACWRVQRDGETTKERERLRGGGGRLMNLPLVVSIAAAAV